MNWSAYSRFVGDVFGAPLAMEGLAAFFLESTFLALWLFGWDALPRRRAPRDDLGGRARAPRCRRRSSWRRTPGCSTRSATRSTPPPAGPSSPHRGGPHQPGVPAQLRARPPGLAGHRERVMLGVSAWHLRRGSHPRPSPGRRGWPWWCWFPPRCSPAGGQRAGGHRGHVPADEDRGGRGAVGHLPAVLVLAVPDRRGEERPAPRRRSSRCRTCCRCWRPTHWNGEVLGINELQAQYEEQYGPGDYVPNVFIQYWSMRVMAYLGTLVLLIALWGCGGSGWLDSRGGSCASPSWTIPRRS